MSVTCVYLENGKEERARRRPQSLEFADSVLSPLSPVPGHRQQRPMIYN